ncbi:NAD(P)H-binding protein [Amycolatopsis rubida]|uniref:NAD(P)H-binding n=1 Tax=Amycolatopsis rubida TaxID=112413 RepID=A0A1I6APP3_9PSEU|nr:NAD(P)H-binding [Amycolatopsis rubida]
MTGQIVVFGATGYTGGLVLESLTRRGVRPVLAARNRAALEVLAAGHGDLETAVADVSDPASLRSLAGPGDVLIATVWPVRPDRTRGRTSRRRRRSALSGLDWRSRLRPRRACPAP